MPPGAEVEFEIELLSADDAPLPAELSVEERLKVVDAKRERGNRQFQEGNYSVAEKMLALFFVPFSTKTSCSLPLLFLSLKKII